MEELKPLKGTHYLVVYYTHEGLMSIKVTLRLEIHLFMGLLLDAGSPS